MITILAQGDPTAALDFARILSNASPALMLALFIIALLKRWLVLPRELDDRDKRIVELEKERDEYKDMTFSAIKIGEKVVDVTQERTVRP